MKILCIIDSLGSGGAQRQITNLAIGLKRRKYNVELLIYNTNSSFYKNQLVSNDINLIEINKSKFNFFTFLFKIRILVKRNNYDYIISFQDNTNIIILSSLLFNTKTKIIISERTSHQNYKNQFFTLLKYILYIKSNFIVTNSFYHSNWVKTYYSWLQNKLFTIYNGFEINYPLNNNFTPPNLLVIARISEEKNCINIIEALNIFYLKNGFCPNIKWAGRFDNINLSNSYLTQIENLFIKYPPVKDKWEWMGEINDINSLIKNSRALLLASKYEGLSNVICESFIMSRPVLISNVCEHPTLIGDNERGFLFDQNDIESIYKSLFKMVFITEYDWNILSQNSYEFAVKNFSLNKMVNSYISLLNNNN